MQQLPKIPIGLKDAGPALRLKNFLQATRHALNEGRERDHYKDLKKIV